MLEWIQGWYNWPFLLSLFVGLGLAALSLLGFSKDVGGGGIDLDGDGVPDIGTSGGRHEPGHLSMEGFGWLGLGKAPLSVLLQTLTLSFGLIGLIANAFAHDLVGDWDVLGFPLAFAGASFGAVLTTRGVASLFFRFMPPERATGKQPGEFVRKSGKAASRITSSFGQVQVEEENDHSLLNACVAPDTSDIERGTEVLLVGYDKERRIYLAIPLPSEM